MRVLGCIQKTKFIIERLQNYIVNKDQYPYICLWQTLESALNVLYIFVPKFVTYRQLHVSSSAEDTSRVETDAVVDEHVAAIINASALIASIIMEILAKFKMYEDITKQILDDNSRLLYMISEIKTLVKTPAFSRDDYMVMVIDQLHTLLKSLMFVFSMHDELEEQQKDDFVENSTSLRQQGYNLTAEDCALKSSLSTMDLLPQQAFSLQKHYDYVIPRYVDLFDHQFTRQ
ncbi:hypothetical protein BDF20DRAFT_44873 [Mycotypha africana]|uniref:uncharacterized protein n=1 Tax=Mycotypha africana TaxID=64632 RepID=UPI0022FFCF51|nr:uncharacterized protein BDF20DRAFT_44873 [Mycotypha africana]KAI8991466.1 hypothetical protein BDF20DRAFT_44873 [Mycotypha africana]